MIMIHDYYSTVLGGSAKFASSYYMLFLQLFVVPYHRNRRLVSTIVICKHAIENTVVVDSRRNPEAYTVL